MDGTYKHMHYHMDDEVSDGTYKQVQKILRHLQDLLNREQPAFSRKSLACEMK